MAERSRADSGHGIGVDGHGCRIYMDGPLSVDGRTACRGKASGNRTVLLFGAAVRRQVALEAIAVTLRDLAGVLPGADN